MVSIPLLISCLGVALGLAAGFGVARLIAQKRVRHAASEAEGVIKNAQKEAETVKREALLQAKDHIFHIRPMTSAARSS